MAVAPILATLEARLQASDVTRPLTDLRVWADEDDRGERMGGTFLAVGTVLAPHLPLVYTWGRHGWAFTTPCCLTGLSRHYAFMVEGGDCDGCGQWVDFPEPLDWVWYRESDLLRAYATVEPLLAHVASSALWAALAQLKIEWDRLSFALELSDEGLAAKERELRALMGLGEDQATLAPPLWAQVY